MKPQFKEKKAVQAAAYLIDKRNQGHMSYMKLLKLLYLADREALIRWGRPIIFDKYSAMDHGMVLSKTLDLIHGEEQESLWDKYFQEFGDHEIKVTQKPDIDELSKAEISLLDEVFKNYGHLSRWDVRDLTHDLPEWVDPDGASIPVAYEDVLRHSGKTPAQIEAIKKEIESVSLSDHLFGKK